MKSAACFALIILAGSSLTATEPASSFAGPIAQAVEREARAAPVAPKQTAESDWSRVRKLAYQDEIVITVNGAPAIHGYFFRADESGLTVRPIGGGQTLKPVARTDVVEIRKIAKPSHAAKKGALIGAAVAEGFMFLGGNACDGNGCAPHLFQGMAVIGVLGLGTGAWIGSAFGGATPDQVIYCAPSPS